MQNGPSGVTSLTPGMAQGLTEQQGGNTVYLVERYSLQTVPGALLLAYPGRHLWDVPKCDEDIHAKRLAAVPWASFCIRCQDAVDRNLEEVQAPRDLLVRAA